MLLSILTGVCKFIIAIRVSPRASVSSSLELNEQLINSDRVTGLDVDGFDDALALALQDVLHLHGLDNAELLAVHDRVTR